MAAPRRLKKADLPRVRQFWIDRWGGDEMVIRGQLVRPDGLDGFVAGDWLGLVTFYIRDDECEITSLDSLSEGQGIGTALIEAVAAEARQKGCRRVALITTNDNLHALGFYQRRGFVLASIHRGAIDRAREIKPTIPLVGENNIPIRDEIELELPLEE
jgi:ribosomal protein S18 acetylase RimI-like enzyme